MTLRKLKNDLPVLRTGRFLLNSGRILLSLILSILFPGLISLAGSQAPPPQSFLSDAAVDGAQVGLLFKDIDSGTVLFAFNADKRFMPASNLKLFTSAAALTLLGPEFRFRTSVLGVGKINHAKRRLEGDLVIEAGGDPLLSGRFRADMLEIFRSWADSLKARDIETISGNIIVNNAFFENDDLGPGWSQDDLSYWYACPTSAFSFNDNCVDLKVIAGKKANDPCLVRQNPPIDYIKFINRTFTLPSGSPPTIDFYRFPGSDSAVISGGLAIDDTVGIIDYISVADPAKYAADVLLYVLRQEGITVTGRKVKINDSCVYNNGGTKIFEWQSDSLPVVISVINKNSQNFFAEQTLKTIGRISGGKGSYPVSTRIVAGWLESIGIAENDIKMADGSGLSALNLVKPSALVTLLEYMKSTPMFDIFYNSLAIPGIDRSVRSRMSGQPLAGRMRTKTGRIANVSAFSGYLTSNGNRLIAFCILINGAMAPEKELTAWQDKLCSYFIENY